MFKMNIEKDSKRTVPNDKLRRISFRSFEKYDWLGCGFSTRLGGVSNGCFASMNLSFSRGDDPENVRENIRLFAMDAGFDPEKIVMPHQCHTVNVQTVGIKECGRGVNRPGTEEEVDGQITDEKGVVLFCFGADCVPVFIVDTEKKVISASHAGWKGTVNDITAVTIGKMKSEFGCSAKNMKAVIGPSICGDCYEVSRDVADVFILKYSLDTGVVRSASDFLLGNQSDKYYLNLWEANRLNLIAAGINEEDIEICGMCTKCHPDLFFSHRVHGDLRGVNAGYIFIKDLEGYK